MDWEYTLLWKLRTKKAGAIRHPAKIYETQRKLSLGIGLVDFGLEAYKPVGIAGGAGSCCVGQFVVWRSKAGIDNVD